jgi:hypothetical protein
VPEGEEYPSRKLSCHHRAVDEDFMTALVGTLESELMAEDASDVEFFGIRIKVKDPRLAALLNSDVTDDVRVVVERARGANEDEADQLAAFDSAGEEESAER